MRKFYFLMSLLLVWQINAQTINEPANWPNADWSLTGTYSEDNGALEVNPLEDFTFSYNDDAAGAGVANQIAIESPVIDLTVAFNNGETVLRASGAVINNYANANTETLIYQWYDADADAWVDWGEQIPETAGAPNANFCGGQSENYTTSDLDISGFTATQQSGFRYRINYDDGGGFGWGFCVVGPTLRSISCFNVTDITVADITTTGANLSWVEGGSESAWEFVVQPAGTGEPTGSGLPSTSTTVPLSGLPSGTCFEIYVRANCGDDNFSGWEGPVEFCTVCDVITTFPWTEDFEGVDVPELPSCFAQIDNNDDGDQWVTTEFFAEDGILLGLNTDFNGGNNDDYIILPQMALTGNQRLIFDARVRNANEPDHFRILVSTTGTNPEDFTEEIFPLTLLTNTVFEEYTINELTNYSGDVYIAFHVPEDTENDGWWLYLDNLRVEDAPDCLEVSNVALDSATTESLTIGWDASLSGETEWEYVLQDPGTGEPTEAGMATTDNPVTIDMLTENTEYEFYIRSKCADDALGAWTGPFLFRTACGTINTFPWTEDFETDLNAPELPSCWASIDNNGDGDEWQSAAFGGVNNSNSLRINVDFNGGNNDDYLILPPFDLTGNERLAFTHRIQNDFEPDVFRVVLSTSGTNPEDFTEELLPPTETNDDSTEGTETIINLSDYTGVVYIAIHMPMSDTDGWWFYVDNFRVEENPSCIEVSDIVVDNVTTTEATISWTNGDMESAWEYVVQDAGTGEPTEPGTATDTNPTMLMDLTPDTDYEVWVRANCEGELGFSTWVGPVEFRTGYCIPESVTDQTFINTVTTTGAIMNLNNVDSGFAEGGYIDYSDEMILESWADGTFNYNVEIVGGTLGCAIFVDWNNDLMFDVDTETIFTTAFFQNGPFQGSYTVPTDIPMGDYRMRIIVNWLDGTPSPCDIGNRVEAEDYTLRIGDTPTCLGVEDIAVDNITATSADITWNASPSGESSWEYVVQPVGTGMPTEGGTPTTEMPSSVSDLESITMYEVWVRADCGEGDYGFWTGPVTFQTRLINDECDGALELTVGSTFEENAMDASVDTATDDEVVETQCTSPVGIGPGVWFTVTVPELESGADLFIETGAHIATGEEGFDSVIQVYNGSCDNLAYLACDDEGSPLGGHARVQLTEGDDISAGDVLYVVVWEWGGNDSEPFAISAYSDSILSTVEVTKNNGFDIYPNPTSDVLNIRSKKTIESSAIYHVSGKKVAEYKSETELNVRNLPKGVYFIQVKSTDGTEASLKFIKR